MRRVIYLLTAVVVVFSATLASAQTEFNHDPASTIGPNFWGELTFPFATCGAGDPTFVEVGKKQSPVDIVTADAVNSLLLPLRFQYKATDFVVEHTGHVVEVPYAPGSALRVGLDKYELLQFHFHAPSEHTVNGTFADAELHLVHRNKLLDLAVVGVLVKVGSPVNTVINEILLAEEGEELGFKNAKNVLPRFDRRYYNYSGSLTTPPCSEGVRWFVLKRPVFVSQAAIDHLHEVIAEFPDYDGFPDNNRPVRPLNDRAILK
ncbi:MAG: carbonic anhydrase [Chromatiales bacterium]